MPKEFPLTFTLEDGVHVTVNKTGDHHYQFVLKPEDGIESNFTYSDDKPRNELIEALPFDQLNAVRKFWLEQEDM